MAARRFLRDEELGTYLVRCSSSKPFSFVLEFVSDVTATTAVLIRSSRGGFIPVTADNPQEYPDMNSLLRSFKQLNMPFASPIPKMPWFHGDLDGNQAFEVLKAKPPGTFLLRFSSQAGAYALQYKRADGEVEIITLRKDLNGPGYTVTGSNKYYYSIEELIAANSRVLITYLPNPAILAV